MKITVKFNEFVFRIFFSFLKLEYVSFFKIFFQPVVNTLKTNKFPNSRCRAQKSEFKDRNNQNK